MRSVLAKRKVKIAEYWPSYFLRLNNRDEVEVSKIAKKEREPS